MVPIRWMLAACLAAGPACAQSVDAGSAGPVSPVAGHPASSATPCQQLCAGQPVELELLEAVSSGQHKNGHRFALRLAAPLMADGVEAIPAGTTGIGEVIHASSARAGGKPGELLLAARHLELSGHLVPLRAMKLSARGKDQVNASLAVSVVTGPFGLFVRGGEIEIPAGTLAQAKLAQDLDAALASPPAPSRQPMQLSVGETPITSPDSPHPAPIQSEE